MYLNDNSVVLKIPNLSKAWILGQYILVCAMILSGAFPTSLDQLIGLLVIVFVIVVVYYIIVFVLKSYETIIVIQKNTINVKQRLLWITYFKYTWDFEQIEISTKHDEISFIDKNNDKISFTWQFGIDFDEPDYFILVMPQKNIDLGVMEQYQDFKEDIEKFIQNKNNSSQIS